MIHYSLTTEEAKETPVAELMKKIAADQKGLACAD